MRTVQNEQLNEFTNFLFLKFQLSQKGILGIFKISSSTCLLGTKTQSFSHKVFINQLEQIQKQSLSPFSLLCVSSCPVIAFFSCKQISLLLPVSNSTSFHTKSLPYYPFPYYIEAQRPTYFLTFFPTFPLHFLPRR